MCNPAAALALTAISAGMQFMQGQQAAAAIKAESQANAEINRSNAEASRFAANDALQRGANDAATIRENAKRANASLQAQAAGSGLLTNTGSLLDFFVQNRGTAELDALTTVNNAEREAYGYKVQAAQSDANAANTLSLGSYRAKSARMEGFGKATNTLLTGFGSAYNAKEASGSWWSSRPRGYGVSSNPTPIRIGS